MRAQTFYRIVTTDRANLLARLIELFDAHAIAYCVIGGQAVNAYVEPLVSLDLDLVIATQDLDRVETLLAKEFTLKHFPHRINVSAPDSGLRVQIQTDPRYAAFVARAEARETLGTPLKVAAIEDVLRGKVWAAQDPTRRGSKRLKDLTDIARLLDAYPQLSVHVPQDLLDILAAWKS